MDIVKVLVNAYAFVRFILMVNVSAAGVVKVLKKILPYIIHMKYCFGCDGKFGAEDGVASSRKSSYRRLQRDPEVLPTDLRVIRAFYESQVKSYSSPLCLDCALFRVLGYTDRYDEKRNG